MRCPVSPPVSDPLDFEVNTIGKDLDLGMVATVGENSEDIAGSKFVTGVVTTVEWNSAVDDLLKVRKGDLGEVKDAYVGKFSTALWVQCTNDDGVLVPVDIAAGAGFTTRVEVK